MSNSIQSIRDNQVRNDRFKQAKHLTETGKAREFAMGSSSSNRKTDVDGGAPLRRPACGLSEEDQFFVRLLGLDGSDTASGLPVESFLSNEVSERFLFWVPDNLPTGDSVCISSSRLGQKLDQHGTWFDALRTIAVQMQSQDKFLVTAAGTTTDLFVRRISKLFEIPTVEFKPIPDDAGPEWIQEIEKEANPSPKTMHTAWYRPTNSNQPQSSRRLPNVNDLLISISRISILLSVRKSGNIFTAANRRLESQTELLPEPIDENVGVANESNSPRENQTPSTRLLIDSKLTSKSVETTLLNNGASGWWLYDFDPSDQDDPALASALVARTANLETVEPVVLELDEVDSAQFVLHWTRRRVGPWPDQTDSSYVDDLLFNNSRCQHSEMAALCRILASRKILGSNALTRDPRSVVCFSDLPIEKLKERRVFRPHLSRWDFEPYGLAIDRDLLAELGARPVLYGNESDWNALPQADRPFFQTKTSASGKIDWTHEQEWRIIGDLNLDLISRDRALVFVATAADAKIVAGLCHWPIVIMD